MPTARNSKELRLTDAGTEAIGARIPRAISGHGAPQRASERTLAPAPHASNPRATAAAPIAPNSPAAALAAM